MPELPPRPLRALVNRDHELRRTLESLDIPRRLLRSRPWRTVYKGGPDESGMSYTYDALNADLLRVVARGPIRIAHVTGEARALLHPAHRNVIAANWAAGVPTTILCRSPFDRQVVDAVTFVAAATRQWAGMTWDDLLDLLALCGRGAVRLAVLKEDVGIHYSLYGLDRLQVQSEHRHDHDHERPSERKRVWYLRSPELVRELEGPWSRLVAAATPLPNRSFNQLLQWLYSEPVERVLHSRTAEDISGIGPHDVDRLVELGLLTAPFADCPSRPLLRPGLSAFLSPGAPVA